MKRDMLTQSHTNAGAASSNEPLDLCLALWKDLISKPDRALGGRTARGLAGEGDGYGGDLYDDQLHADMRIAEATDAMINSLPRISIWAVHYAHSVATVWNFPNTRPEVAYLDARQDLEKKLRRNPCTAVLF
jgi:hypothetical protein